MNKKNSKYGLLDQYEAEGLPVPFHVWMNVFTKMFIYLFFFPGLTIFFFWFGYWILGIISCVPTIMGLMIAVFGKRPFEWFLLKVMNWQVRRIMNK